MEILAIVLSLAVLSFGLALIWVHHLYSRRQQVLGRVSPPSRRTQQEGRLPDWLLKLARDSIPSGERYTPPGQREKIGRWLAYAGNPYGLDLPTFLGLRFVVVVAALLVAVPLTFLFGYQVLLALLFLGYFAPVWWLKGKAEERQDEIAARLPDFIEALAISLRAGTGFYPTLRRVAQRFGGPLGAEFTQVVLQIEMGQPMAEALQSVKERTACRELDLCVEAIAQGLELGVPIADTLAAQARALRTARIQRAKEQAAKASPKITLITTLLVTPGVFLLLIGMVLLNMFYHPEEYGIQFLFH
ncbi:MAG: type II secretion system F family protein [Symbiobacteriaceae bacterium]